MVHFITSVSSFKGGCAKRAAIVVGVSTFAVIDRIIKLSFALNGNVFFTRVDSGNAIADIQEAAESVCQLENEGFEVAIDIGEAREASIEHSRAYAISIAASVLSRTISSAYDDESWLTDYDSAALDYLRQ